MEAQGLSTAEVADMIAVNKSTLSRSLRVGAFSGKVRQRLRNIIDPVRSDESVSELVRKALRIISASDKLRVRAERLLIEALDQSAASK